MSKHYKLYIDRIKSTTFDCFEDSDIDMLIDTVVKGLAYYAEQEDVTYVDFDAIKKELKETGQVEFSSYRARIIDWNNE